MKSQWVLQEADVDWLTVTAHTGDAATWLLTEGGAISASEVERGERIRPSNFQGYHGTLSNHCFFGFRLDGAIVRVGGKAARDNWRRLVGPGRNVTRLDLALTAKAPKDVPTLAGEYYDRLDDRPPRPGRPTEYTHIRSKLGGETLYCGRRSSEQFGRVYDKHRESKGIYPVGSWRFEVEYKGERAKQVAAYLSERADVALSTTDVATRRFEDWGISVPFDLPGNGWRPQVIDVPSDNATRFAWLETSVSTTVERLSTTYSAEEIRQALGLQYPAWERYSEEKAASVAAAKALYSAPFN